MKNKERKIELASAADLFSTEQERQDAKLERLQHIPLSELYPFPDHPFSVKDDDSMMETVESVKERGVITPVSVQTQFPRRGKTIFHFRASPLTAEVHPKSSPLCQLPPQNWVASVGTFAEVNTGESLCFQGFLASSVYSGFAQKKKPQRKHLCFF